MVAPGSVTSRLGSVFPFLLVLVDLQYEGESCPVLAGGAGARPRPPGASPPASGRESRGGPGGRAGAGESARPGWASACPWAGAGARFRVRLGEEVVGPARRRAGTGGFGGRSGVTGGRGGVRGARGTRRRLLQCPGTRRPEQPSGPSLATRARRLGDPGWVMVGGGREGGRRGGFFRSGVPGEGGARPAALSGGSAVLTFQS